MKKEILQLRSEGKSYKEIKAILGCSSGTICYHCGEGQKEKAKRRDQKNALDLSLSKKTCFFKNRKNIRNKADDFQRERINKYNPKTGKTQVLGRHIDKTFTYKDVLNKFGEKTKCYLTGRDIDLLCPKTYCFDHKIPHSRGGESTLDNLGITCKQANIAKNNLLIDEFFNLCKEILEYNGYKVTKLSKTC